jgi:tripartite-type tricarboxylate transporter receptor subunit TctC
VGEGRQILRRQAELIADVSSSKSIEGKPMTHARRRFLQLAGATVAACVVASAAPPAAWAQAYPTRPVHVIVPTTAGATTDIIARLIAQSLGERLGQQFIIENRPGGGNTLGTEAVVRSPADGYTLLLINAVNAINVTLFEKLNYNFSADIVPVAGIIRVPLVMQVNPAFPAKTVPEFIAYAKANPGKINMASAGTGTTPHVAGELFKMMAGVDLVHVPYRGGAAAMTDLISGQVQVMFEPVAGPLEHLRAGRLRALAVTTTTRSAALPDVPTVGEFVPGYEASSWYGIGVPKGTPAEVVDMLNRAVNAALADPRLKARFADLGATVLAGSPADFGKLVADETEKWRKVVKFSGARAD